MVHGGSLRSNAIDFRDSRLSILGEPWSVLSCLPSKTFTPHIESTLTINKKLTEDITLPRIITYTSSVIRTEGWTTRVWPACISTPGGDGAIWSGGGYGFNMHSWEEWSRLSLLVETCFVNYSKISSVEKVSPHKESLGSQPMAL